MGLTGFVEDDGSKQYEREADPTEGVVAQ